MAGGDELGKPLTLFADFIPIGTKQVANSAEVRCAHKGYSISLFQVNQHPFIEDLIAVAYYSRVTGWEPAPHGL